MANAIIPEDLRKMLARQHYKLVGNHSAVKLCMWLKKSIRNGGFCYKQKFYPEYVKSHTCLQMSPSACWCNNRCVICWRSIEKTLGNNMEGVKIDEPKEIIEGSINAQRLLLSGFRGWQGTNMKKWKEAQNPQSAAISLIGEPTLYPRISELIEEFHDRKMATFLVTNGQVPESLERVTEPKQLYISLDAPDKDSYKKIDQPSLPDFWDRLNKSLELMNSFSCRKVLRLTLVKDFNMDNVKGYAKLIEKAGPDFIEAKSYMFVGESRNRLPQSAMPRHNEVMGFAEKLAAETGYRISDEQKVSRVVLLKK